PPRTADIAVTGDASRLSALAAEIIEARLALQGIVLAKAASEADWRLVARFAAGDAAVERSVRETAALATTAGLTSEPLSDSGWREMQSLRSAGNVIARGSVLPSDVARVAEAMAGAGASVVAMPGVGIVY